MSVEQPTVSGGDAVFLGWFVGKDFYTDRVTADKAYRKKAGATIQAAWGVDNPSIRDGRYFRNQASHKPAQHWSQPLVADKLYLAGWINTGGETPYFYRSPTIIKQLVALKGINARAIYTTKPTMHLDSKLARNAAFHMCERTLSNSQLAGKVIYR